jgi:putative transposase
MEFKNTYTQILGKDQNALLWKMARESAKAYTYLLKLYEEDKDFDLIQKRTQSEIERKYLHSQSFQASYQLAVDMINGYFAAMKAYEKNPQNFTGVPRFPTPDKHIQVVMFKQAAIRYKDGYLLFSSAFRDNPIKVRWNADMPIPCYATISMDLGEWNASFVFKKNCEPKKLGNEILGIDLGIKRIAATFDGTNTELFNGKMIMSFVQLENKKKAELKSLKEIRKENGKRKHSRRVKRRMKGIKKQIQKIKRKKNDILHKMSRYIVNKAVDTGIGSIVIGDCSSIHQIKAKPAFGKKHKEAMKASNQSINQGQEIKLSKQVEYKFKKEGGLVALKNEAFTSQECPRCDHRNKPENREYVCSHCGFKFDRDGVGAINIRKKVSQDPLRSCLLARPRGIKYIPQLSYSKVVKTKVPKLET